MERPRLMQRLDDGLRLGNLLTLVCAPPGYGKTTLLSAWVHAGAAGAGETPRLIPLTVVTRFAPGWPGGRGVLPSPDRVSELLRLPSGAETPGGRHDIQRAFFHSGERVYVASAAATSLW